MTENEIKDLLKEDCVFLPSEDLKHKVICRVENFENSQNRQNKKSKISFGKMIAVAACFVLLLVAVLTSGLLSLTETDTIYMDVNPSIGLVVNCYGTVKRVEFFGDSVQYENDLNVKYKSIGSAIESVLSVYDDKGILRDADVYLSVQNGGKNKKMLDKVCKKAGKYSSKYGYHFNVCKKNIDKGDCDGAKKHNISPNKYNVILQIMQADNSYQIDQLKNKTMKELNKILESLNAKD